jgi:hypothetical protein
MLTIPLYKMTTHEKVKTSYNEMEEMPMKMYEVYELNRTTGYGTMIGILPERRRDRNRTTRESVLNWGRVLLGDKAEEAEIYFVEIILQKTNTGTFWPFSAVTSLAN